MVVISGPDTLAGYPLGYAAGSIAVLIRLGGGQTGVGFSPPSAPLVDSSGTPTRPLYARPDMRPLLVSTHRKAARRRLSV